MAERVFTQTFGVAGAIIEKDGKILLVKEGQGRDKGKWNRPAGWLDIGENPIEAVKREIKEEAGLDFMPKNLIGIYSLVRKDSSKGDGVFPHALLFIFCGNFSGSLMDPNEEISELKWFTPEEIYAMDQNTLRDASIKLEVKDYINGKRYPLEIIHHTVQEKI